MVMQDVYYIEKEGWQKFLENLLSEYELIAPVEEPGGLEYRSITPENLERIVYPGARLAQSAKFFIYPPQETVSPEESLPQKKKVILGVKACDLKALAALDEMFLKGDLIDPFYKTWRENTILISSDCPQPGETCFCNLLGGNPFAESGFDLNLSFIDDGVLVEAGSEKGKEMLEKHNVSRQPAGEAQLKTRDTERKQSVEKLKETNKEFSFGEDIADVVKGHYESPVWQKFAETCVGCCACTNICPSCHCFLLADFSTPGSQPSQVEFKKLRYWDSCQSTGYARVAGGANPRKKLADRLKNRYYCKFEYKPSSFNILACTGCGRCVDACQGKIDIREVLSALPQGAVNAITE